MKIQTFALAMCGLAFVACDSTSGSIHEAAQARFSVTAVGAAHDAHHDEVGGDTQSKHSSSYITFRNAEGVRIDLQLGLVNLVPVEVKACTSVASVLKSVGQGLIGAAWAHAGEHEEDEATDVLDALTDSAKYIGALPLEVGRYCAVVLALDPLAAGVSKHADSGLELSGHSVNVYPCYFHNTAQLSDEEYAAGGYDTSHSCVQFQVGHESSTLELEFDAPITVSAERHHLTVELAAHFETWFDGIVMDDVSSVESEQAKLLANIRNSIHVDRLTLE